MKRRPREDTPTDVHRTGDIKKDFTKSQLAAFGAATLAYNILEDQIDALLFIVTRIPDWLFADVSSRIHGLDGKIAIIQNAVQRTGLVPDDLKALQEAIALFGQFKTIRDGMIHARIINASIGIGRVAKQRGKSPYEILLSAEALNIFYDHIVALEKEFSSGGSLLNTSITLSLLAANDPNRAQFEEALRVHQSLFRENHKHRRSLKRLPKFPDESELREAANRWREAQTAALMDWFRPLSELPQRPAQMSPALHAQHQQTHEKGN
jgi:hypothetical protein